jgi:hypothetical protein
VDAQGVMQQLRSTDLGSRRGESRMAALPPTADIRSTRQHVRLVPTADVPPILVAAVAT